MCHEAEALERVWTLSEKLDAHTVRVIDWDRVVAIAEELHMLARSMLSDPNVAARVPPGNGETSK